MPERLPLTSRRAATTFRRSRASKPRTSRMPARHAAAAGAARLLRRRAPHGCRSAPPWPVVYISELDSADVATTTAPMTETTTAIAATPTTLPSANRMPSRSRQREAEQGGGEGRQPIAERDRQGDRDRHDQRDDADHAVAAAAPERPVARPDHLLDPDQPRDDAAHHGAERLGRNRAVDQDARQPDALAAIDHLRRRRSAAAGREAPRRRAAAE